MIGKLIALVAFVAAIASADCGFYRNTGCGYNGYNGYYGGSVLNVAPTFSVASAVPACSPIAVPSCVVEPIRTVPAPVAAPVVAPVVSPVVAPVVAPVATEVVGYGNAGYLGGCGCGVSTVY